MRERMVAEIRRDVTDVDLARQRRSRRWINDRREPRLIESRVRNPQTGAMGDESSLSGVDGESEAVEGEHSRNRNRRKRGRKSRTSIVNSVLSSRNDSIERERWVGINGFSVGCEIPASLDPPHESLNESNEVSSLVDQASRFRSSIQQRCQPHLPHLHLSPNVFRPEAIDRLTNNLEPFCDAPVASKRTLTVRETVLKLFRDEIRNLRHVTRPRLIRTSPNESFVTIDDPFLLQQTIFRNEHTVKGESDESSTHIDSSSTLPIADTSKRVDETTDSFREVRVELDSSSIIRDRFLNLTRVFDSIRQICESNVLFLGTLSSVDRKISDLKD